MNLVPLLNPKFAIAFAARCARTSGSGTSPAPRRVPAARNCRAGPAVVWGNGRDRCRGGLARLGPVAQWLEPTAHNGLVGGSSPPGPTSNINGLLTSSGRQFDHRTSYRTRYVPFSFRRWIALHDLLDCIGQVVRMMVPINVEQNFERHSKIARRLPWIRTPLHQPCCCRMPKRVRRDPAIEPGKPYSTLERRLHR
jgi:hypothetical protein